MPVNPATLGGAPTPAQGGNLTVTKTNEQREEHIVFQREDQYPGAEPKLMGPDSQSTNQVKPAQK